MLERVIQQNIIDYDKAYNECNEAQKEAIDCTEGTVMVVAGPGTGKTQIIAARIANIIRQGTAPENILCLTYTDAGTIAMRERLLAFLGAVAYRINIFTFHAFCNSVIQDNAALFGFSDLQPISDLEKTEVVQAMLDSLPHDNPLARDKGDLHADTKPLLSLYATMKRENWDPREYCEKIDRYVALLPTLPGMRYARNYKQFQAGDLKTHAIEAETKKYERTKAAVLSFDEFQRLMLERRRYDFDDMIIWVIREFNENPDLLIEYQERYQYVLVDEYQDTSGSQNDVVDLLMSYWNDPNLFIVGDDDQSIYRFQGASINNILSFNKKYSPGTVVLTENYRSTQQILDAAMAFIELNCERLANNESCEGVTISKKLTAAKLPDGDLPIVRVYPNVMQESLGIALDIENRFARGVDLSKLAVLYRNHKQADLVIRYLKAKGVPYSTKRREDVLNTPIVKQLLSILTYLNGEMQVPHSQGSTLFGILQHPSLKLSPLDVARLFIEADQQDNKRVPFRVRLPDSGCALASPLIETSLTEHGAYSLQEYIHRVLTRFGILEYVSKADDALWQMTALNTFFGFIQDECAKSPRMSLADLMRSIEIMQKRQLTLTADRVEFDIRGVNFITCHSAKGLEFETVFLVGCNESEWEGKRAQSGFALLPAELHDQVSGEVAKIEEMRRLFYVAMTRAEKELIVSYAARTDSDKALARSQFVAELQKTEAVCSKEVQLESHEIEAAMVYVLQEEPADLDDLFTSDLIGERLKHFKLSVSHLNTYLKCPRTFFYESLLRVPQVKNASMAFGTSAHAAFEYAFRVMKKSADHSFPSADDFIARFEREMYRHQDAFDEVAFPRRLKSGGDNLRGFYERYASTWSKNVLLEEPFQAVLDGEIPLNGLVDRLDITGQKAKLVDYKTGRYDAKKLQPPDPAKARKAIDEKKESKYEDQFGGDYWRQAVFYKFLVEHSPRHSYQVETTEFCFVEPDEKSGDYVCHPVTITPDDEDAVRQQIVDVYARIMRREFGGSCSNKYCSWCR